MKKPGTTTRRNGTVRCGIYTRKSSEEGLEQEFNSLQAQREACEAFIDSQRHEGWVCLRAAYDDGGFSGATMDRPALQQLLADITAGRVDTVVVYKIDRLTRSLADFAKIVEILDAKSASFVSVTQQFNTTTSMGVRRDKAALSSGCEAHPANSLQPEATGAGMEATKCLKPSDSGSRNGDRASVQAATRVNAEHASKRSMCRPTRRPLPGKADTAG